MINITRTPKTPQKAFSIAGFTLVEIMVVVAIITILTTIVITTVMGSRAAVRDKQRITDLQQIRLALKLYQETYGSYPCENTSRCPDTSPQTSAANGQIGIGNHIDSLLAPFMAEVPVDPVNDASHYYYYDPSQYCEGHLNIAVVFARTMESEGSSNPDDMKCLSWGGEGGAGQPETYMVIVGNSPDN